MTACSVVIALAASAGHKSIYRAQIDVEYDQATIFYAFLDLDNGVAYGGINERALLARDPQVISHTLAAVGLRKFSPASLLDASSARPLSGDSSRIRFSVENADRTLAARLVDAYAYAFQRTDQTRDVATAQRVLPLLEARIRAARPATAGPRSVIRSLEHQLALLRGLPRHPLATVEPLRSTVRVWPRPVMSSILAAILTFAFTLGLGVLARELQTRWDQRVTFGLTAISFVGAAAIGLGTVWIEAKATRATGLAAGALLPGFAALAGTALPLLASFVVFAQVFKGYELQTPVAAVSPGVVALLVLLFWCARHFAPILRERVAQVLTAVVVVLVGAHAVQFMHLSIGATMRSFVTVGSLALFWLAGLYLARQSWGMVAAGIGAVLALCLLGLAALGVAAHVLPGTNVISVGRNFFGFHSPLPRTYGLQVGSLPSLFLPLAIPWLTLVALEGKKRSRRVAAVAFVAVLLALILLSFQSRSMLMQICAGVAITAFAFRAPWWRILLGFGTLVAIVAIAVPSLLFATDRLSTANRWDSYKLAGRFFSSHPRAIFVGTDAQTLVRYINTHLVPPQPPNAPIHDTFLQFLAQGGILAALAAGAVLLVPLGVWLVIVRRRRSIDRASAWIPAVGAMLAIDMVSFALVVDAGNGWLALGMMCGYASATWNRGSKFTDDPSRSADCAGASTLRSSNGSTASQANHSTEESSA